MARWSCSCRAMVLGAGLVFAGTAAAAPARAQPPQAPTPVLTAAQEKAQQHFRHAKELYQQGSYREAIAELEAALTLDPSAKDLVYNLAIVNEKLANVDESLRYFRRYSEMDLSPPEREKCDSNIRRLEGAKREIEAKQAAAAAANKGETRVVVVERPREGPPERGRIDTFTIAAAAVGAVGLVAGATFGLVAITSRPSNVQTGPDRTYESLVSDTNTAHGFAIASDIGFVVGIGGAVGAVLLYALRTKAPVRPQPAATRTLVPTAVHGGGGLVLQGSF